LQECSGILVPGGFGSDGVVIKEHAVRFALTQKRPFLGICLGMQIAVILMAKLAGLKDATSREFDPETICPVIEFSPGQKDKRNTGNSMRLGNHLMHIKPFSLLEKLYGFQSALERHRHRCEVNLDYKQTIEQSGLRFSGVSPDGHLLEVCELPEGQHPFFIGCQFHPEYSSRPLDPHPLFVGFTQAAARSKE
jgi:CTP synthase